MRRAVNSWTTTLTRLGFKRQSPRRRSDQRHRRPRLETLEDRRVLHAGLDHAYEGDQIVVAAPLDVGDDVSFAVTLSDGIAQASAAADPQFVISGETAELFAVETIKGTDGRPQALISIAPGADLSGRIEHELDVSLIDGDDVIATQRVSILLPPEDLVEGLAPLRLQRAESTVESPDAARAADLMAKLDTDGAFTDLKSGEDPRLDGLTGDELESRTADISLDRLNELAKWVSEDAATTTDAATRESLYAGLATAADDLAGRKDTLTPAVSNRLAHQLGATATLLLDQLQADAISADNGLAAAAADTLAKALAQTDVYYGSWTGLGVNSRINVHWPLDTRATHYTAFYETGTLALNEALAINLAGHTALVRAIVPPEFFLSIAAATMMIEVGSDASVYNDDPYDIHGSESELDVWLYRDESNFHEAQSYLQFELAASKARDAFATGATLKLTPSSGASVGGYEAAAVDVRVVADDWDAATITFVDNRPTPFSGPTIIATFEMENDEKLSGYWH